jgi:hypothetical protein
LLEAIVLEDLEAEDVQDSDEIAFDALDRSVDSSDEPVEELVVDGL